ncbi:MAG: methyltransferase, partial [Alphaproteobacteria bacterium]
MATDSDEFFFHLLNSVALYRANLASLPVSNELYFVDQVMRSWPVSSAQNFQDLFIALYHQHARGKFFVEFGATDGVALSNTLMLERELGWSGILAEPARGWHAALRQNRRGVIDTRCVWKASGETIDFIEPAEGSFST